VVVAGAVAIAAYSLPYKLGLLLALLAGMAAASLADLLKARLQPDAGEGA
jgi:hypothetical protein